MVSFHLNSEGGIVSQGRAVRKIGAKKLNPEVIEVSPSLRNDTHSLGGAAQMESSVQTHGEQSQRNLETITWQKPVSSSSLRIKANRGGTVPTTCLCLGLHYLVGCFCYLSKERGVRERGHSTQSLCPHP